MALGCTERRLVLVPNSGGMYHSLCDNEGARGWFSFVTGSAWISTFLLSICYFFNAHNAVKFISWPLTELVHNGIFAVLCFIAGVTEAAIFPNCAIYAVAATFAFFLFAFYTIAALVAFIRMRSSQ